MKIKNFTKVWLPTLALSTISLVACSQPASPAATAEGKIGEANVSIKYSSPSVRGRQIYGELVPYGKVWRTGANAATVFETDKDLTVEGKTLPAGKYSIYTIPGETVWTIIFNSQTGQWGITHQQETTEDPAKDVLRVTVTPKKSATMNERFLFTVQKDGITISWDNLDVPVSIK